MGPWRVQQTGRIRILTLAASRDVLMDELLGHIIIGNYEVFLYRHAGALLTKMSPGAVEIRLRLVPESSPQSFFDLVPLLDRDIELAAVQSLLQTSPPPVVEVSGRVGVGKTALVRRLSGVLYIDAVGLDYRMLLQRLYERACDADIAYVPTIERLRIVFAQWRIPIVIDGFEGSAGELYTILDVLKSATVVYTTKEPMHLDPSVMGLRLTGLRPHAARELFERSFGVSIVDDVDALEFVNIVLEGNPLLIGHAGALARAGALSALHGPESLAALTFNNMSISEQQIFGTIAAFEGSRPDRTMIESVSGVTSVCAVLDVLIARHIVQTDGDCVWVSPLMHSILSAIPALARYDIIFEYLDLVLSESGLPRTVTQNPKPFLVMLARLVAKGRHEQVVRNGRTLVNALLLAGRVVEAREACEMVRLALDETYDPPLQAWVQHQLGTLSALSGDSGDAITRLESAEELRGRIGENMTKLYSRKNAALLRGKHAVRSGKRKGWIVRDITVLSWAMLLVMFGALYQVFDWFPAHMHNPAHAHVLTHWNRHTVLTAASLQVPHQIVALPMGLIARSQPPSMRALRPVMSRFIGVPRIAKFSSSTKSLVIGGATALCFNLTGATSAFLQPIGKINIKHAGCVSDTPRVNTYYTLYAYNRNGMTSASVYVDVLTREGFEAARVP
jgi:hypothetical protein